MPTDTNKKSRCCFIRTTTSQVHRCTSFGERFESDLVDFVSTGFRGNIAAGRLSYWRRREAPPSAKTAQHRASRLWHQWGKQ
jgi:hypothetical protein